METIRRIRLIDETSFEAGGITYRCTIGRNGIAAPNMKREGDLKTPAGAFPLRVCYYRPDRVTPTLSGLELVPLTPEDGWCDDPDHPYYNQPVKLPFDGRHEKLWRDDHVYDLIIPLGYNDGPIVPGLGSAIFLHLMREDRMGTEGCVAVAREVLLALLPHIDAHTVLTVDV